MPKVICTLENASNEISGIVFKPHPDGGKISEEISEEQAESLLTIPGFEAAVKKPAAKPATPPAAPAGGKKAAKPSTAPPATIPPADSTPPDNADGGDAQPEGETPPAGDDEGGEGTF